MKDTEKRQGSDECEIISNVRQQQLEMTIFNFSDAAIPSRRLYSTSISNLWALSYRQCTDLFLMTLQLRKSDSFATIDPFQPKYMLILDHFHSHESNDTFFLFLEPPSFYYTRVHSLQFTLLPKSRTKDVLKIYLHWSIK